MFDLSSDLSTSKFVGQGFSLAIVKPKVFSYQDDKNVEEGFSTIDGSAFGGSLPFFLRKAGNLKISAT